MGAGNEEADLERYARLRQLGWDMDLLRRSQVLMVGAGALGNEIVKNLALAGVGNIFIVDPDTIESHNLTRSVLFRPSDVGRGKAEVAAEAARAIDPNLKVRWSDAPVQQALGLGMFRQMDVVMGGVDNIQTRRDLNRACMLSNKPLIDGGLYFLDGDVRVFLPPFPVCYDCTVTQEEREEGWRRWSCLKFGGDSDSPVGPTAPTVASMVGGLQAQLALKYLHRAVELPYPMRVPNGVRIRFNGFGDEYERWDLNRDTDCPTHLGVTPIPESAIKSVPYGNDMPTAHLLEIAQGDLGPDTYVELGFDLVHTLVCHECGASTPSMRRSGTLAVVEATCTTCTPSSCRSCGESVEQSMQSRPDLVFPDHVDCASCFQSNPLVIRESQTVNRIERDSPTLKYTLSQLGVPKLDILEAKAFDVEYSVYF